MSVHPSDPATGTLYLVPTPIGDPRDFTLRAIEVLGAVGLIAAEDTRTALNLLQPLGIQTRLVSYHDHNEESRTPRLLNALVEGTDVALISDAGTPLVNDPGYRVVTAAIERGIRVVPLPGASAAITALIGSGLPVHQFCYAGFLPRKSAARQAAIGRLKAVEGSLIFFEAPHRLAEMLADLAAVLGDRPVALARNLSRASEQFVRGTLAELGRRVAAQDVVRGQYTVVVGGSPDAGAGDAEQLADRLIEVLLGQGATGRLVRDSVRELTGLPRNWVYERVRLAEQARGPVASS